ncbi:MAG: YfhO family protein [Anaerolineae bacterium]
MNASPSRIARREAAQALALLAASLLVFFWPAIVSGEPLLATDLIFDIDPVWRSLAPEGYEKPGNHLLSDQVFMYYPWETFSARSLAAGYLPLWNPYTSAGLTFIGNPQAALFSPFHLIGMLLPTQAFYLFSAILRLWVAGVFTYLFARALGMHHPGALMSMVTFAYAGPLIAWLSHIPSYVLVWLPAMLWASERALSSGRLRFVAAAALFVGAQFLEGHPETSFHVLIAWAAYVLYRALALGSNRRQIARRLALAAGAFLLGTLFAAPMLLPFGQALLDSATLADRGAPVARTAWSTARQILFDWRDWPTLVTVILPRYFGTPVDRNYLYPYSNYIEQNAYLGIIPLALAISAIPRLSGGQVRSHRGQILFFALLASLSLGIAAGLPLLNGVNDLPLFRIAANRRMRMVYGFAGAMLAGFGMDGLIRHPEECHKRVRFILIAIALCALALQVAAYAGLTTYREQILALGLSQVESRLDTPHYWRSDAYYREQIVARYDQLVQQTLAPRLVTYLPLLVTAGWLALDRYRRRMNPEMVTGLILSLVLVDVMAVWRPFHPTTPSEDVFPLPPAVEYVLGDQELYRVSGLGMALYPNTNLVYGLADIRGYDTLVSVRYDALFNSIPGAYRDGFHALLTDASSPLLDLLNVRYLFTPETLDGRWQLAFEDTNVRVYRNSAAFPRAYVVHEAKVVDGPAASLRQVADGSVDLRRTVVLEKDPPGWVPPQGPPPPDPVRFLSYEPNRIEIEVQTDADGLLVLTDTYAPGWQARVDGMAAPILIANHAFRAVVVSGGAHVVEFAYRPPAFRLGIGISVSTIALLLGVGAATWWVRRRKVAR